ncbi:Gfo/Idh/MocA family protein [Jiangella gansuensis]|uniref:Gfo/Idh/MocA family protein n=1 Tax=Jiangella gansuensis TaxID=281473 RepID=UPI00047DCEF3|nr:Gfo/Idh/MocA family oxidoreductase [Jiangella gansuensis]
MIESPLRVAIVGSGFIAGEHLDALSRLAGVVVVGIVDIDPSRAADAARRAGGIASATDLAEAINLWACDAAVVCTPNDTHGAIATTLAEAGVHALVEKPLATDPAVAARLAHAFDERGLVLAAAHTHRFAEYSNAIKQAIDDGEVGRPVHARLTFLGGWLWTDWRNWQINRQRSGGHGLHNGVHLLDLVTWWLGDEPTHVHAQGRKQSAAQLEVHDHLLMTVGFASGATAICEMSRANHPRHISYRDAVVVGTEGTLRVPWDGEAPLLFTEGVTRPVGGGASPFLKQAAAWVAAVRGEQAPAVTGADGLRAVVLGVAAERSMATGDVVAVADVWKEIGDE